MFVRLVVAAVILAQSIGGQAASYDARFELRWAGATFSCITWDGRLVRMGTTYDIQTAGEATNRVDPGPEMLVNPAQLSQFSPPTGEWLIARECAHHQLAPWLNTE